MTAKTENRPVAVKISGVKKMYKLGQIGGGTLQADLQSWWAKVRGKEDPNTKIGEDQRSNGQTFMALNGIDLTIYQGEAVGIIGSNGAGKSTLLKLLSKVTAPSAGVIDIYGRIASMLEVGTGFNGEMTGRENVYMNGAILGMTKAEIDAKMEQIIEFSEVREFIDTPVKRYSSGMFVKLAFSVAAHLDSEIMIMDEVLAVGDVAFQKKCLDRMHEAAAREGRTVLYVSHNMNTIRQLCTRCVVLDKGKLIYDGEVDKAIAYYMKTSEDSRILYDFSSHYRSVENKRNIEFLKLEIIESDSNKYILGQQIKFIMHCKVNDNFKDCRIRFEIAYADDTMAGTVFSNTFISGKKGEMIDLTFSFPTANLASGLYKCAAIAFTTDGYGNQVVDDRVAPALVFELLEAEENKTSWLHQWWGHVRFDDIEMKKTVINLV